MKRALLALALSLSLVGCGGSKDESSSPTFSHKDTLFIGLVDGHIQQLAPVPPGTVISEARLMCDYAASHGNSQQAIVSGAVREQSRHPDWFPTDGDAAWFMGLSVYYYCPELLPS